MVFTAQTIVIEASSRLSIFDVMMQERPEASSSCIASFISKIRDLDRQLGASKSNSMSSVERSPSADGTAAPTYRRALGASPSPGIGHSFVNGRKDLEVH